jgi:formyl-CoA transferase
MIGSLYGVIGIQAAVRDRERTGRGRHIDISLVDCATSLVAVEHFEVYSRAGIETRSGSKHTRLTPFGAYQAADGSVAIAAHTDQWVAALFQAMDQADLVSDPRFSDRAARIKNSDALNSIIEEWTSTRTMEELVELLHDKFHLPVTPVRGPEDAVNDESLMRRGAVVELRHPVFGSPPERIIGTGLPIMFSGVDGLRPTLAPLLGQHTYEVLAEIGLSAPELAELSQQGVI